MDSSCDQTKLKFTRPHLTRPSSLITACSSESEAGISVVAPPGNARYTGVVLKKILLIGLFLVFAGNLVVEATETECEAEASCCLCLCRTPVVQEPATKTVPVAMISQEIRTSEVISTVRLID